VLIARRGSGRIRSSICSSADRRGWEDVAGAHRGEGDGANITTTSGPVIEKAGDLAGLLTTLQKGDVLFIDEIHRLNKNIEEYLYPAMEDFRLDIIIDQGRTRAACDSICRGSR